MSTMNILKNWALRFLDLLVVTLALAASMAVLYVNGAFISNIINSFRASQYIDVAVGVQIALVIMSLFWIPLLVILTSSKRLGRR
mgnify:CR=1 FL=1